MKSIVVKSKVSADGILHLSVPIGLSEADTEVKVTVEAVSSETPRTQQEWSAWVDSMAGSWEGDFERPAQGVYENRETLS